jgi:hypothetical protein
MARVLLGRVNGYSAYETWVHLPGNEGKSEADFFATLESTEAGPPGYSAYEWWTSLPGNAGKSEAQFLAALKGSKGDPGESAYELWLSMPGNVGKSEENFLNYFRPFFSVKSNTELEYVLTIAVSGESFDTPNLMGKVNVLVRNSLSEFPAVGSANTIYVSYLSKSSYVWGGSAAGYVQIATMSYNDLGNKPAIDGVGLNSESTSAGLGLATAQGLAAHASSSGAHSDIRLALSSHEAAANNPHNVTAAQVGLGNVNNTLDSNKPVSVLQQAAISAEAASRIAGDSANANSISSEAASRIAGDAANAQAVEAEAESRGYVDSEHQAAIEKLNWDVQALQGRGGDLQAHDFGAAVPTQEALTAYALSQIPSISEAADIWTRTSVVNLFDDFTWRLNNTPDTDPPVFEWVNVGHGHVSTATNETQGILRGVPDPGNGSADGFLNMQLNGTAKVLGFSNLAPKNATLTDSAASATIPGTSSTPLTTLLQTVRNNLKALFGYFNSGVANSAAKLATARTIQTNLASTSSASFDGSAAVTPGVTGTLPIANGGTGNTTGLAASATKLATARTLDGVSFDGSGAISHFGTCSTAASTAAKTVAVTGFSLVTGAEVTVTFTVTNTAANPTLNVNGTGAKPVYYRNAAIGAGYLEANRTYKFVYDGTQYELVGDLNVGTTYAVVSKTANGLAPQLPNETATTKFLRQDGGWAVPPNASQTASGFMSSADKSKLDGIQLLFAEDEDSALALSESASGALVFFPD